MWGPVRPRPGAPARFLLQAVDRLIVLPGSEKRPRIQQRTDVLEVAGNPQPGVGVDGNDGKTVEHIGRNKKLAIGRQPIQIVPLEVGDHRFGNAGKDQQDIAEGALLLVERLVVDPHAVLGGRRQAIVLRRRENRP